MTTFRGSGGPPPTPNATGSRFKKLEYVLSEKVGETQKKVSPFLVRLNSEVTGTTLDEKPFEFSVRMHQGVKINNSFSNNIVCISQFSKKGCPVCDATGEKGKWFTAGTILDGSEWEIPSGKNKGRVIKDQRRLLLVNARQLEAMKKLVSKFTPWRGREWSISRGTDQKTPRIGDMWLPNGNPLTEAQLAERYSKAAADYGTTVEKYLTPFNYDEVLKPMSFEELEQVAAQIRKDTAATAAIAEAASDNDIPF